MVNRMTTNTNQNATTQESSTTAWLLDSDPAIRWQVLSDLTDSSPDEVAAVFIEIFLHGLVSAPLPGTPAPEGEGPGHIRP